MKKTVLTFILFFTNAIFSIEPIKLDAAKGEFPLGLYLEILEDKEGKLTLSDIQKPEMESLWFKSQVEVPSFGFTKSIYWVRFRIDSTSLQEYFLELRFPQFDKVTLYLTRDNLILEEKQIGDHVPFREREVLYKNLVFILKQPIQAQNMYYMRFETTDSMQFPISIWSSSAFSEKNNSEMLLLGLFFGVLIVMGFYNLFLWLSIRDRTYFYYVIYIFTFIYFWFTYTGLTYQFIWNGSVFLYHLFYFTSLNLFCFLMLSFTISFLQTEKTLKKTHRILHGLRIILLLSWLITAFLDHRIAITIVVLEVIISAILMLFAGIMSFAHGYRTAKFYLLAWTMLLFGGTILAIKNAGFLPANFFTEYSAFLGSALEVILLSFGLADRINDLQKQNEISQIRALEAEKKANKVKDEFLANLSHELRTPMTSVFVLSEMLADNKDYPEEVIEYSKEIRLGAGKLNDYVNDLILVTDIESNLELQKSNLELQSLVSDVIKEFNSLLEEKNIQLFFEKKGLIEMNCDPILLPKAIAAVIKNAIVYNKQNGEIHILLRTRKLRTLDRILNGLEIKVTDTGIGIPQEYLSKVFDKFFRVDTSLSYEVSGVGIGLFIAKKIVELHGGGIEVKSELGIGSEFTISLPLS